VAALAAVACGDDRLAVLAPGRDDSLDRLGRKVGTVGEDDYRGLGVERGQAAAERGSRPSLPLWTADDARVGLEDFRNETGLALSIDDEAAQDVDTLGGLVIFLLGRVPQRGEIIAHPAGYEFEVLEADPRRVKRLRIRPPALEPTPAS